MPWFTTVSACCVYAEVYAAVYTATIALGVSVNAAGQLTGVERVIGQHQLQLNGLNPHSMRLSWPVYMASAESAPQLSLVDKYTCLCTLCRHTGQG